MTFIASVLQHTLYTGDTHSYRQVEMRFCCTTPCCLVLTCQRFKATCYLYPSVDSEDGGNRFLQNDGTYLPDCMTRKVRRYCDYAMGFKVWGSNPGMEKIFFSYSNHQNKARGPQSFLFNGYRHSFPGVKAGRKLAAHLHLVPRLP